MQYALLSLVRCARCLGQAIEARAASVTRLYWKIQSTQNVHAFFFSGVVNDSRDMEDGTTFVMCVFVSSSGNHVDGSCNYARISKMASTARCVANVLEAVR